MPIRLLLVDDHTVVRHGRRVFLALDPDVEFLGEAAPGASTLDLARRLRPDVMLMDLPMPDLDGIAATTAICYNSCLRRWTAGGRDR